MCMEKYIEIQHITKIFPGQKALDDVSFSVNKGEIHALVGENGAGKSTLCSLIPRFYDVTGGAVKIDGKDEMQITIQKSKNNKHSFTDSQIKFLEILN